MMLDINFSEDEMTYYLLRTKRWEIAEVVANDSTVKIAFPSEIPFENFIVNKNDNQILEWEVTKIFKEELKNKLLNDYYDGYHIE
jgi:hypothetical protein